MPHLSTKIRETVVWKGAIYLERLRECLVRVVIRGERDLVKERVRNLVRSRSLDKRFSRRRDDRSRDTLLEVIKLVTFSSHGIHKSRYDWAWLVTCRANIFAQWSVTVFAFCSNCGILNGTSTTIQYNEIQ